MKTILSKSTFFAFCIFAICALLIAGCSSLLDTKIGSASSTSPYSIKGECVLPQDGNDYQIAGFEFVFRNSTDKDVTDFTLVFYVYDEDGNSALVGTDCVITKCEYSVPARSEIDGEISLDGYLSEATEVAYHADYIFVSEINYADGSKWHDNFGLFAN